VERRRVLIVDDDEITVLLLRKHLEPEYDVVSAGDGAEAIEKARLASPDVILLDVNLPDIQGFEVCRRLKAVEDTRLIPVVMLTSLNDAESETAGLEAGADDFLIKPAHFPHLKLRVRNLSRMKRLIDDRLEVERRRAIEAQERVIMRDALNAVTGGKLWMMDREQIDAIMAQQDELAALEIRIPSDVGAARAASEESALRLGIDRDRVFDLVLCVSEAATNTIKHAHGGRLGIRRSNGCLAIWVSDTGPGIDFKLLPQSTVQAGFSTKASLGHGFTILLQLMDRVLLSTNTSGTVVVLEMSLHPPSEPTLNDLLERFPEI